MVERHKSKDRARDSDRVLGTETEATPSQGGRGGGSLARAIGSEDELKRAEARPAGKTRVRKSDEDRIGTSNLGKENR